MTERNRFIKDLMAKMDLKDKVGEMTQVAIDVISKGKPQKLVEPHTLVKTRMRDAIVKHRVGSILNVGGHAYTREHWYEIMESIQDLATKEKKSGIPVLYGIDAIHGANYTQKATLFPQQLGLAATWNPSLATKMGEVSSYETRASTIPWNFSPVCDLGYDPRWSRLWEGFGEDVLLASEMIKAAVEGYQGNDVFNKNKVAACLKHFMGYSMPLSGKDRSPAWIPERKLREYVMPPFQAGIDAGAKTVMICSGEVNGEPVHASKWILTDLLRKEMGFEGLVVSDWEDIHFLYTRHRVAKDYKDAVRLSVNAGLDMAMVPFDLKFPVLLKELVEEGKVPMSRINVSVERILKVKYDLGLFENPYYPKEDYKKFASKAHTKAAFEAALESIVLLKNEKKTLPLSKKAKVLVTGPTANLLSALNGGWTGTWQGDEPEYDTPGKPTILEAIQNKIGKENVTFVEGTTFDKNVNTEKAATAAEQADVIIACVGEYSYTEKPGDIDDLTLPKAQQELVHSLAASGKPVILILAQGRPRIINEIEPKANAIIGSFYPGNEGGRAIADILFGDYNPNGKMPFTYPKFINGLERYDHKGTDLVYIDSEMTNFRPQFEFGFGLSYTSFKYSSLKVDPVWDGTRELEISVDVQNTGKMAGKEVVQLYIADLVASITPSVKKLKGFQKINLEPGETKTVTFKITLPDLAFVGLDNQWVTEHGEFEVLIGDLKKKFELQ